MARCGCRHWECSGIRHTAKQCPMASGGSVNQWSGVKRRGGRLGWNRRRGRRCSAGMKRWAWAGLERSRRRKTGQGGRKRSEVPSRGHGQSRKGGMQQAHLSVYVFVCATIFAFMFNVGGASGNSNACCMWNAKAGMEHTRAQGTSQVAARMLRSGEHAMHDGDFIRCVNEQRLSKVWLIRVRKSGSVWARRGGETDKETDSTFRWIRNLANTRSHDLSKFADVNTFLSEPDWQMFRIIVELAFKTHKTCLRLLNFKVLEILQKWSLYQISLGDANFVKMAKAIVKERLHKHDAAHCLRLTFACKLRNNQSPLNPGVPIASETLAESCADAAH